MTKFAQRLKHGSDQAWKSISDEWRELGIHASGPRSETVRPPLGCRRRSCGQRRWMY